MRERWCGCVGLFQQRVGEHSGVECADKLRNRGAPIGNIRQCDVVDVPYDGRPMAWVRRALWATTCGTPIQASSRVTVPLFVSTAWQGCRSVIWGVDVIHGGRGLGARPAQRNRAVGMA